MNDEILLYWCELN